MIPILVDTGPIVALLDPSEQQHGQCVEVIQSLRNPLFTCEAVIAECCYLLRNQRGAANAILENVENGIFQLPYRLTGNSKKVSKLLKKYADVPMDFADACLVDMATESHTGRILTLDRDFLIYRWNKNRAFDYLLEI